MMYPFMEPPFPFDSFEAMDPAQAKEHFEWFLSCIPERIALLDKLFREVWGCVVRFDFSIPSLDAVWGEFEKHIETEERRTTDIAIALAQAPQWLHDTLRQSKAKLTKATLVIAMDIGMYYGEVVVRNLAGVHWGFLTRPKRAASVNRPVLLGFPKKMTMDPSRIVLTGCWRSLEAPNPSLLTQTLGVWKGYLSSEERPS